jgi:membrane-associated phospholipid phosphatase
VSQVVEHGCDVPRRVSLLAIAFLGFLSFGALSALVWHVLGPVHVDQRARAWLPTTDASDRRWLMYLSDAGGPFAVVVESLALAAIAWWRSRNLRVTTFCAVVPIVVVIVAELMLKPVIERRSGSGRGLLFPSGHTTGVASVATAAWLTWVLLWRSALARLAGAVMLSAVVIGVGVSRVMLHSHYATDVAGGALYGAAATLALSAVWLPSR